MMVEIYAAIIGAAIGLGGASVGSFGRKNAEAREAIVRLTVAVENISEKLEELHTDMKQDRKEIHDKLSLHENRITLLEGGRLHKS